MNADGAALMLSHTMGAQTWARVNREAYAFAAPGVVARAARSGERGPLVAIQAGKQQPLRFPEWPASDPFERGSLSVLSVGWERCVPLLGCDDGQVHGAAVHVAQGLSRELLEGAGLQRWLDDQGIVAVPALRDDRFPGWIIDVWLSEGWLFGRCDALQVAFASRTGPALNARGGSA